MMIFLEKAIIGEGVVITIIMETIITNNDVEENDMMGGGMLSLFEDDPFFNGRGGFGNIGGGMMQRMDDMMKDMQRGGGYMMETVHFILPLPLCLCLEVQMGKCNGIPLNPNQQMLAVNVSVKQSKHIQIMLDWIKLDGKYHRRSWDKNSERTDTGVIYEETTTKIIYRYGSR